MNIHLPNRIHFFCDFSVSGYVKLMLFQKDIRKKKENNKSTDLLSDNGIT